MKHFVVMISISQTSSLVRSDQDGQGQVKAQTTDAANQ